MTEILIDADYVDTGIKLIFYNTEKESLVSYNPKSEPKHNPYFLVESLNGDENTISSIVKVDKIEKTDLLLGKNRILMKIQTKSPLDVERLRNRYKNTYEDKIHYVNCYIYDYGLIPGTAFRTSICKRQDRKEYEEFWKKVLLYPVPNVKRTAMDLEIEEVGGKFPSADIAEGKILCIVFHSVDKTILLILRTLENDSVHQQQLQNILSLTNPFGTVEVKCFDKEISLILEAFKIFNNYPFLVTYNGASFDLKYLYNRAVKLGLSKKEIPIKIDKKGKAKTTNTCHLDIYYLFYHHEPVFSKIKKYADTTLDSVSKALLGEGQVKMEKFMKDSTYFERLNRCKQDAKLTYNLTTFNDNMIIKLVFMLSRISRHLLPDACTAPYSLLVKGLFDAEHRRHNYLIPNKNDIKDKNLRLSKVIPKGSSGKYAGATVLEPVPGIHFDVLTLDFPSMYPSIISERNLSYSTVCCDHSECKSNKIEGTELWVCKKREGFLSVVIGSLKDFRIQLKRNEKYAKNKEEKTFLLVAHSTVKLILNASYGIFGSENQELYLLPLAAATTSIGRNYLRTARSIAESIGLKVVYGDTDSILVKSPTNEQINKLNIELSKHINMTLDEGIRFRYVIMSKAKKNYLGIDYDENIEIKGLTGKKRHVCKYIKSVFQNVCEVLKEVKRQEDFEKAKIKIKNFIKEAVDKLYLGEYELKDLAFSFTLGKSLVEANKNSQIYRAVDLMTPKPQRGETISIVFTKGSRHTALPLSMTKREAVDLQAYISRLSSTMRQILEPMDIDFDEIIGNKAESLFKFTNK